MDTTFEERTKMQEAWEKLAEMLRRLLDRLSHFTIYGSQIELIKQALEEIEQQQEITDDNLQLLANSCESFNAEVLEENKEIKDSLNVLTNTVVELKKSMEHTQIIEDTLNNVIKDESIGKDYTLVELPEEEGKGFILYNIYGTEIGKDLPTAVKVMLNEKGQFLNRLRKNKGKHRSRPNFRVGAQLPEIARCSALGS